MNTGKDKHICALCKHNSAFTDMGNQKAADSIGARAKEVRVDRDLQQQEIADLLGMSLRAWQKMERDEGTPSGETLLTFTNIGINPGWILSGLGPKNIEGWYSVDAEAELFMRVGNIVQEAYEEAHIPIPERGLLRSIRAVLADLKGDLDGRAGPEEIKSALAYQKAKLKRQLQEAVAKPGSGKASA